MNAQSFMDLALAEAKAAQSAGEIPVGCVVVCQDQVVARSGNRTERDHDPTAHAEMVALRAASQHLGNARLSECDVYVTLEPCTMCAGGLSHARIRRLYYGAADVKGGAIDNGVRFFASNTCHHSPEVYGGVGETAASQLLTSFFKARR